MIPREILKKIRQIELRTNRIVSAWLAGSSFLALLLLCSCATQNSARPNLPAETSFNETAGRGSPIFVTLTLKTGEKLLFFVDTGCPETILDKSLEPKLGKRLGTGKTKWVFSRKASAGIYEAPELYLGNTRLLTGARIKTDDFSGAFYSGIPIMGFLGMDCLRHYCIQLDFAASKMRFLDSDHLEAHDLGKAFPLSIFFGGVFLYSDILDANKLFFRADTGLYGDYDFLLKPKLFQWEMREQKPFGQQETPFGKNETLFSKIVVNGETYTNFVSIAKEAKLGDKPTAAAVFSRIEFSGETYTNLVFGNSRNLTWPTENLIGLRFFARNLVTFNFPKRMMYLRQTSIGSLIDEKMEKHSVP